MKASDISDEAFVAAVRKVRFPTGAKWANVWDVAAELGYPEKVVLAKFRRLKKRNILDGCGCGCRGDFEVIADQ